MAASRDPDDEIIGFDGYLGPGGSVSVYARRRRDLRPRSGGCCGPIVGLLLLGLLAAWALEHLVARPRARGGRVGAAIVRPRLRTGPTAQHNAAANTRESAGRWTRVYQHVTPNANSTAPA